MFLQIFNFDKIMRTERLWWVLALVAFWGLALFGHKFWHRSYGKQDPIFLKNSSFPIVGEIKTVHEIDTSDALVKTYIKDCSFPVQVIYNNGLIYIRNGDRKSNKWGDFKVIEDTTSWFYNHSEIPPLSTAE